MRRPSLAPVALAAAALALSACGKTRPTAGSRPTAPVTVPAGGPGGDTVTVSASSCTSCHGTPGMASDGTTNPLIAAAPPRGVKGELDGRPVGAHDKHLRDGLAKALACANCHLVPASSTTHRPQAQQGRVTFALVLPAPDTAWIARGTGGASTWSGTTCASTYCHGNFPGGNNATVTWERGAAGCGSCHGTTGQSPVPTSGGHPTLTAGTLCATCHPGYGGAQGGAIGTFSVNRDLHVNGRLDSAGGHPAGWVDTNLANHGGPHAIDFNDNGASACTGCHGATLAGGAAPACTSCHDGASHTVGATPGVGPIVAFLPGGSPNCSACHGGTLTGSDGTGMARAPAPPLAARRTTARPDSGSHAAHLPTAGGLAAPANLSCAQCHASPATWYHADGTANLAWGSVATGSGAKAPAFSQASNSCSATWCHGNFQNGNNLTMTWGAGASAAACGTCHGTAGVTPLPASGHPALTAGTACSGCHTGYGGTQGGAIGTFTVNAANHVNGAIDATNVHPAGWYVAGATGNGGSHSTEVGNTGLTSCATCHGADFGGGSAGVACVTCHDGTAAKLFSNANCTACHGGTLTGSDGTGVARAPAPPAATRRTTVRPDSGSHAAHLPTAAGLAAPANLSCAQCHATPATWHHADGTANLAWGATSIATGHGNLTGAAAPSFDQAANSCASTWCHGNFRNGNNRTMTWGAAASAAACGTCHGLPPAGTHPALTAGTACSSCHPGYGGTQGGAIGTFTVNTANHVNGAIDAVGNHPAGWAAPGQHGLAAISFTAPNGGLAACTGCHQSFGSAGASSASDCTACHTTAGHANWQTECTFCHGGNGTDTSGAPPRDTSVVRGTAQATTLAAVGAHRSHVEAPHGLAPALDCSACHGSVPTDLAHVNGAVPSTFASVGGTPNPATYALATGCSANYCHGGFAGGAGSAAVAWTGTFPGTLACTSCHGAPPTPHAASGSTPVSYHPNNTNCVGCHGAGYSATTVAAATHVNGAPTLNANRTGCVQCHGLPGRTGVVAGADANVAAAPTATASNGANANAVGAHDAHVNSLAIRSAPLSCATCHTVPASGDRAHANGSTTASVTFPAGGLARTGGLSPVYAGGGTPTCASTYCHAGPGASAPAPSWNATLTGCGTCHGNPPPLSAASHHPQNSACAACHGTGYSSSAVAGAALATHVNGTIQQPAAGCTACHGVLAGSTGPAVANTSPTVAPGYSASAVDTRGSATGPAAGAHAAHITGTTWRSAPLACSECHVLPATGNVAHATGTGTSGARATLAWGALATRSVDPWSGVTVVPGYTGSSTATTNSAAGSCSSTYCHGNFTNGNNATLSWTSAGTAACGSCHGVSTANGPGGTHPALAGGQNCGTCHGAGYTNTSVDKALHMNGALDGGGESGGGSSCAGCHATIMSGMDVQSSTRFRRHNLGLDVPSDASGPSWAANLTTAVTGASRSCVNMCHGDHPHDLTSPVTADHAGNVYLDATSAASRANATGGTAQTRTSATRAATDFANSGNGGLCLSCHRFPVDAGHPALSMASYGASAHNFTATTTPAATWSYTQHDGGTFARNCTKCHADRNDARPADSAAPFGAVHYSDFESLLAGASRTAGTTGTGGAIAVTPSNFVCYNCHGNGTVGQNLAGAAGSDVYTQAVKAQGHGGATNATPENLHTDAVHDSALEAAATYNGGRFSGANRHVNCLDCHDPHEAGATLHAQGSNAIAATSPLRGATGVTFTSPAASWAATASSNFSAAPVTATLEYQICLKCHSSFAFGTTPPAAAATPSGLAETDVAQEFSTSNQSYHPVVGALPASDPGANGSSRLAAAQLVGTDHTWTPGSLMTCSDCHNADANAPAAQGPHGSAVTFMLAGTNKAWPFTATTGTTLRTMSNTATGNGTSDGLFCRNCHPDPGVTSSGATNSGHVQFNAKHRSNAISTCVRCHIRVPHGGKVSRLIATSPNTPARYQVSGQALNFVRFVKNNAGTYSGNSWFGSSCGEHSGGAGGGEAW